VNKIKQQLQYYWKNRQAVIGIAIIILFVIAVLGLLEKVIETII
jgi:hypothetical protein